MKGIVNALKYVVNMNMMIHAEVYVYQYLQMTKIIEVYHFRCMI